MVCENICFYCIQKINKSQPGVCKFEKPQENIDVLSDEYINNYKKTNLHLNIYNCNFCKTDQNKVYKEIMIYVDICTICQKDNVNISLDQCNLIQPPKYADHLSYIYNIIFIKKIDNNKFIYIVEEKNFYLNNQDVHYYLKYYDKSNIIIDHEIKTYNPYFGVYDISINIDEDQIIILSYHEKHEHCTVKLKPNNNDNHCIYLKSKPQSFARCYNEKVKWHEIGEILELKIGNDIKQSKTYYE